VRQTQQVVDLLREVFDDELLGVYLYGSSVVGGLQPRSDVDLFAVLGRPTTNLERRRLCDALLEISGRYPPGEARPLELTAVVQTAVRPWRYPPQMEFQYGEWLRAEIESGKVLTDVQAMARPLFGPPPEVLIDPVPDDDLSRAMVDCVPGLLAELDTDTTNVLLTLARIWFTLTTGSISPKNLAAEWAAKRLPADSRSGLAKGRAIYLGDVADEWAHDLATAESSARELVKEIRRCGSG
jgi:predicted nucleotidyltransferase